eukprot:3691500-Amphidinium_carterae.1
MRVELRHNKNIIVSVAAQKNEQKTAPRPTYSSDFITRELLRSVLDAVKEVAVRVPETSITYDATA